MVDIKIVNAALSALTSTFQAAAKSEVKLKKPEMIKDIGRSQDIVSTIGFNGVLEGNLIYTMPEDSAKYIVNNMMGGMMEIKDIDEMALSAIGELGNMISGAVAISLEKIGYPINITPPSVVRGHDLNVTVDGIKLKFSGTLSDGSEIFVFLVIKK